MEFSRQEYWSELPFPSPGYLPDPGIKPRSPALQADSLPSELPGKPSKDTIYFQIVPILQSFHTYKSALFVLYCIGAGIFIYIALFYFPLINIFISILTPFVCTSFPIHRSISTPEISRIGISCPESVYI